MKELAAKQKCVPVLVDFGIALLRIKQCRPTLFPHYGKYYPNTF